MAQISLSIAWFVTWSTVCQGPFLASIHIFRGPWPEVVYFKVTLICLARIQKHLWMMLLPDETISLRDHFRFVLTSVSLKSVQRFISVDICSEGHHRLRNSDLVVKRIKGFHRKNVSSKLKTTNTFCFQKGTRVVQMREKVSLHFRKANNST